MAGMAAEDEILDVVDRDDHVTGQAPRGEVYAKGLRHRAVFVLARDAHDRLFVHRRTPVKLVFPSLHDMFVGGVVGAGESYDDAALREAEEELGVSGLPRPEPLFRFLYESGDGHGAWWSGVYEVRCTLPVNPQVEEVAWHDFLTEEELELTVTCADANGFKDAFIQAQRENEQLFEEKSEDKPEAEKTEEKTEEKAEEKAEEKKAE